MTTKRKKWAIVTACAVAVIVLIAFFSWEPEPTYENKSLSQWVMELYGPDGPDKEVPRQAIRAIGTNAIPHLLKWITHEENPSWSRNTVWWCIDKLPESLASIIPSRIVYWACLGKSVTRADLVPDAFGVLGNAANPAIPQLEKLMNDHPAPEVSWRATKTLTSFSTNSIPILLAHLADTSSPYHYYVEIELLKIPMLQSSSDIPASLKQIQSGDDNRRMGAALHFSYIKINQDERDLVVSALSNALNDPNPIVRQLTTNTLLKIAPEVLTNAPSR